MLDVSPSLYSSSVSTSSPDAVTMIFRYERMMPRVVPVGSYVFTELRKADVMWILPFNSRFHPEQIGTVSGITSFELR
jgi:hypothetical protein